MDGTPTPPPGDIAAELASAGFADAREIGRGGFGVVYRCYQTSLGRSVAVKVLTAHFDRVNRERFLREGYAMGGLSGHPHVVHILQIGVTDSKRLFLVMPYYAADSLAKRLQAGPIPWPEAVQIGVKLCGALETAHRIGILHRDIKPGNVVTNDYGEPALTDFGLAHIRGGFKTAEGVFTGSITYTAPEVLAGSPPTVATDTYSLGATLHTLLAGRPAHERESGEDLAAHFRRVGSSEVPDLRRMGIPGAVCAAIERAMSVNFAKRPASAEQFGRELQAAQRASGLAPDSMALVPNPGETRAFSYRQPPPRPPQPRSVDQTGSSAKTSIISRHGPISERRSPAPTPPSHLEPTQMAPMPAAGPPDRSSAPPTQVAGQTPPPSKGPPGKWTPPGSQGSAWSDSPREAKWHRRLKPWLAVAAVAVLLAAVGVYFFTRDHGGTGNTASNSTKPTTEAQAGWQPITNARIERDAVATTQADGTVWIFGGLGPDGAVSGRHEGYDPAIDSWKGGDDLPVPVQHAMSVTWQGNPIVLGGWRADKSASDQVWRVVNGRWVELPRMLQPRAAAAAAVVGDRIIVSGGVGANGALLNTTEIFDGNSWTLGAPIPTPRQMLAAVSDAKLVYAVGGASGNADLDTVEAYDPAANSWTPLPKLPQARSDLGVTIADGRLVAVGGLSAGQVLKSVSVFDLTPKTWAGLPDMASARHGAAVAAVGRSVYAIGGSSAVGDGHLTASAEAIKLTPRKLQPASEWRSMPDAPTPRLMTAWAVLEGKIWVTGGLRDGAPLTTVENFDPQTGAWQPGPSLPIPLHHGTAAAYRGELVVIGGATDNIAQASDKVFALRNGNWVELPALKHARAAPAAAVVGDKLVVIGGQNNKQLVPQTEVFDGNAWSDVGEMPSPREHLAAVSDGTYVYAVGGRYLSSDKNSAAFNRFDPGSNTWSTLVDMPTPRGSYGAAYIDGRIVAVGGEDPTQVLGAAEMYDIAEGKWIKLAPLPTPRHAEVVAAVGNTVYVIGGANRPTHEGPVATIEALDFT
ncbi:MAG: kelch repeat-containing protein [Mycobacterium sp.]